MYRLKNIILVTGVPATLGQFFPSPSPPPAVADLKSEKDAKDSTRVDLGAQPLQHQQHQQKEQKEQKEQKQQKHWRKYMDEYVPAEYRHFADSGKNNTEHHKDYQDTSLNLIAVSDQAKSGSKGGSQSGNYQQYMDKYAGGSQGGSQSGGYQKYYNKYMKQYAGGSQGGSQSGASQSGDYSQYYEKYMTQGGQGGSQSQSGSQSGDYQKYMKQYAGGSQGGSQSSGNYTQYLELYAKGSQGGSQSGDYQKYMKKYAGGGGSNYQKYMKQYAGDYEKYEKRYRHHTSSDAVKSAKDAQNKSELNSWKASQHEQVKWYVPDDYAKYANKNIDRQYNQRLFELQHPAANESTDDAVQSAINLFGLFGNNQQPSGSSNKKAKSSGMNLVSSRMNQTEREEKRKMSAQELKTEAEAQIKKAESLGKSLKQASDDKATITMMALKPGKKVKDEFTGRAKELDKELEHLQHQVNSQTESADFQEKVQNATRKVKEFRDDELDALDHAHRQANQASRHAAHGAQSEVRRQARQVWTLADEMSRKDDKLMDDADKLENRAEEAADVAENNCEELARRTQEHLEINLAQTRGEVRKAAERRFSTLHEVTNQFEARAKAKVTDFNQAKAFLAQRLGATPSTTAYGSYVAALAACAGLVLYVVRHMNRKSVTLPHSMLG